MEKQIIKTERAPELGYAAASQGVRMGVLVFVFGQVGWDVERRFVRGDVKAQTRLAVENIRSVLKASGATLRDVVKVTVFLKNIEDFEDVCEVRNRYFRDSPTASTAVAVKSLVHEDLLVEIEVIAVVTG